MDGADGARRLTGVSERLRLVPIGHGSTEDLFRLHQDDAVVQWYGRYDRPGIDALSADMERRWKTDGVGKWLAYHRHTGTLVGRGGLTRIAATAPLTQQIQATLAPRNGWAHNRLELGWALLRSQWGHGYATEIGSYGLDFAFSTLGASEVVSFTERHNERSRAVMERLGMTYRGEITHTGFVEGADGLHDDAPFALYSVTDT